MTLVFRNSPIPGTEQLQEAESYRVSLKHLAQRWFRTICRCRAFPSILHGQNLTDPKKTIRQMLISERGLPYRRSPRRLTIRHWMPHCLTGHLVETVGGMVSNGPGRIIVRAHHGQVAAAGVV
jgi:hypothetical protein